MSVVAPTCGRLVSAAFSAAESSSISRLPAKTPAALPPHDREINSHAATDSRALSATADGHDWWRARQRTSDASPFPPVPGSKLCDGDNVRERRVVAALTDLADSTPIWAGDGDDARPGAARTLPISGGVPLYRRGLFNLCKC
jgi:hypothetical protein